MSGFHLFVYGTLRSGEAGSGRLSGCMKVAEGRLRGTLYDIDGRHPALLPYGGDVVRGEVWRCPADLLPALDAYEGVASGLFRRIGTEVETLEGGMLPCWVYAVGPALSRQLTPDRRLAGGQWRRSHDVPSSRMQLPG